MSLPSLIRRPRSRLLIAERFVASCARLSEVVLPLDVIARQPASRLRLVVVAEGNGAGEHRITTLANPELSDRDSLRLVFAPFESAVGATFIAGALDADGESNADIELVRTAAADRIPIALECRGDATGDLLVDERGIAAFRIAGTAIRTAYWLDAFWCDAHGIYLRGWVHAFEHPLRALRVESGGRVARVDEFSDRPDLLVHYPDHEHVRNSGFAVYLACPPGHPVTVSLETDGGIAAFALPLPEGPIPAWPSEAEGNHDEIPPTLRRFARLANALGGHVLQIGSRTPRGADAVPPRHLLSKPLIGLDIHPGCNVNLVGDAHLLSRFVRERSLDGVLSASVLEHLQAPWLVAAEINRVLKPGGVVYQQVPGAWPAHAQPNDFWRFSSEALKVLFGPATGFEVLEVCDTGRAAIIPGPDWRRKYLDMPTIPAFAMAEILARKVKEIEPGAVAWPLAASEMRSQEYPLAGLRPSSPGGESR